MVRLGTMPVEYPSPVWVPVISIAVPRQTFLSSDSLPRPQLCHRGPFPHTLDRNARCIAFYRGLCNRVSQPSTLLQGSGISSRWLKTDWPA